MKTHSGVIFTIDRLHALAGLQPAAIRLTLVEQFGETLLAAFLFPFLILFPPWFSFCMK